MSYSYDFPGDGLL